MIYFESQRLAPCFFKDGLAIRPEGAKVKGKAKECVAHISASDTNTKSVPRSAPINVERLTLNRRSLAVGKGNDRL